MFNSILRVIDEKEELSDDDTTINLLEPILEIPCDKLKLFTNSSIDFEIDSFAIKHQEKYISNPIMVRYQLQNIFVTHINNYHTIIPTDIVTVIQSFLPVAPNMNNVRFVQTHYWLKKVLNGGSYSPNDILRNDKNKLEKYYGYNQCNPTYYNNYEVNDEFDEIKRAKITITDLNKQNHLTYDFGEYSQIYAILFKTNKNGLGKNIIKIKIPKKDKWITHSILSIGSCNKIYNGWLGFTGLNILSQLIKFEFDANGAVINELLFV